MRKLRPVALGRICTTGKILARHQEGVGMAEPVLLVLEPSAAVAFGADGGHVTESVFVVGIRIQEFTKETLKKKS
jgi:hypothetical protein